MDAHARKPLPSADEIAKLAADGGPDFNRLIHEKSPYLLQHAANPVDWYPWGPEAFKRAKEEDKPLFVSVGYSSCHWCHVMEHESFENDEVASILNEHFICIKVDREERPDVDEIYMTATQLMTGRGGWPNSVFLLPDGRPWFAGTYFPREDSDGRAGFKTLLHRLAEFWKIRRPDVEKQADQLAEAIRQAAGAFAAGEGSITPTSLRNLAHSAIGELRRNYDNHNGGFGTAPKFPPHSAIALLLEEYRWNQDHTLLALVTGTLDAMMNGGIHDQVGGGFHRYSTDEHWFLPHFEKMLYDNAQLAAVYADAYRATSNAAYAAVARDTCDWVLREMTGPEGGFYSALDADSEGVEGKFYVWTRDEILDVLGDEDGKLFCAAYNIEPDGNYREEATGESTGSNIPYLKQRPDKDFSASLAKLLARRAKRAWPQLDDKVIASWNGLMIGALARAGCALNEKKYIEASERAANFVLTKMKKDAGLLRIWRQGEAKVPAYLDDYVLVANGLLDLHTATDEARWKDEALKLLEELRHRFKDDRGGFFYNSTDHEQLLARTRDPFDQALPSANGSAALLLIRAYDLKGREAYLDEAKASLQSFSRLVERAPTAACTYMIVASLLAERIAPEPAAAKGTSRVQRGPVIVDARMTSTNEVEIKLTMEKGWHINSHQPAEKDLVATAVSGLTAVKYPKGTTYEGTVTITGKADSPPTIEVTFQPCDDKRCLKPETVKLSVSR